MKKLLYVLLGAAMIGSTCSIAGAQTTLDGASVNKVAIQAELDDVFKQLQEINPQTDRGQTLVTEARHAHDDADLALRNGDTLRAQELADASADLLNALNPTRLRIALTSQTQATAPSPVRGNAGNMREVAREDIEKTDRLIESTEPYSIAGGTAVESLTDLAKASLADARAELNVNAHQAYLDSLRARYAFHAAALIASASNKSLSPPPAMEDRANASEGHAS